MPDWATWQAVGQTFWDWGSKVGLGAGAFWLIRRWLDKRDKAVDRGRDSLKEARPEVVPVSTSMSVADRKTLVDLHNRGPGIARDVRVTFTGSAAVGQVAEIQSGGKGHTREMDLSDAPFFHQRLPDPAKLTVQFKDRFDNEYTVVLPVEQEDHGERFEMKPAFGQHLVIEPRLTKKRLRDIGGP